MIKGLKVKKNQTISCEKSDIQSFKKKQWIHHICETHLRSMYIRKLQIHKRQMKKNTQSMISASRLQRPGRFSPLSRPLASCPTFFTSCRMSSSRSPGRLRGGELFSGVPPAPWSSVKRGLCSRSVELSMHLYWDVNWEDGVKLKPDSTSWNQFQ